jgi:HK97 family phage major capsid protein
MTNLVMNTKNLTKEEISTKAASLASFGKIANGLFVEAMKSQQEFSLTDLTTKALTIAGADGEALAIDDVLGTSIIEAAREQSTILSLIGNKTVSSKSYREMVLKTYPTTGATTEQLAGTDWALTDTSTYAEVSANFAKQYAKPQISTEAMEDPALNLFAQLQSLLVEEMSRFWAQQVIGGDGTANRLRGILGYRTDTTEGVLPQVSRSDESYPIMYSGVDSALGNADQTAVGSLMDIVIDLTTVLPSKYLAGASFLMNRRTLAEFRKLKDTQGRALVQFEQGGFTLVGHAVHIEDYWPDIASGSYPVLFGDLKQAFALINYSESFLVDPYSVDGAIQLKSTVIKGDIVQNNDAIVLLCAAVAP